MKGPRKHPSRTPLLKGRGYPQHIPFRRFPPQELQKPEMQNAKISPAIKVGEMSSIDSTSKMNIKFLIIFGIAKNLPPTKWENLTKIINLLISERSNFMQMHRKFEGVLLKVHGLGWS